MHFQNFLFSKKNGNNEKERSNQGQTGRMDQQKGVFKFSYHHHTAKQDHWSKQDLSVQSYQHYLWNKFQPLA